MSALVPDSFLDIGDTGVNKTLKAAILHSLLALPGIDHGWPSFLLVYMMTGF